MATDVVAVAEVISGVPVDWLPDELVKAISSRRAQQNVRAELELRRDDLRRGLAEVTTDSARLLSQTKAIREVEDALAVIPQDVSAPLPGQELAIERASGALAGLALRRFLGVPPVIDNRRAYRAALDEWRRGPKQNDPPTHEAETKEQTETAKTFDALTRRADDWAGQVKAWQESPGRLTAAVSMLAQAGNLARIGEALLVEGQTFTATFDAPGRPARDLVGRIR